MDRDSQYIIVDSKVLPEVFSKVLEAKSLLAKGIAKNSTEACKMAGISRGAYYKYKDSLFTYSERMNNEIVTFHLTLADEPGVLSSVLSRLYETGANVLTVNQNIPNDKVADVTVSVRMQQQVETMEQVIQLIKSTDGVLDFKQI